MNINEINQAIALLEAREQQAGSLEMRRELRQTLAHFRVLQDRRIHHRTPEMSNLT